MTEQPNPLVRELHAARAVFRTAWESVPTSRVSEPPSPGAWSAHLVLAHIARTEGQVARLVRGLWESRPRSLAPLDGSADVAARLDGFPVTDRSRRFEAPSFAEPNTERTPEELWARLDSALERIAAVALECAAWHVSSLTQPHPLMGTFDLHQWILFSAHHERRHAQQLAEIAASFR